MLWYHDARMFTGHCPMTGVQIMSTTFMSSPQIRNRGKENIITFPRRSCVLYLYLSWPSQYFKKHWSDLWPVVENACTFVVTQGRKSKEHCSYTMFSKHQSSTQGQMKHPSELVLQKYRRFGGAGVIMVTWLVGVLDIQWTSDRPCPDSRKP